MWKKNDYKNWQHYRGKGGKRANRKNGHFIISSMKIHIFSAFIKNIIIIAKVSIENQKDRYKEMKKIIENSQN